MDLFFKKGEMYYWRNDASDVTDKKIFAIETYLVKEIRKKSCLYRTWIQSAA